jgi:hypothetical protein
MLNIELFLKGNNHLISNKMTKEELEIEISTLCSKIKTLISFKQTLVDAEKYEDAAKVRDYIISIREIMLIYTIMIKEENTID